MTALLDLDALEPMVVQPDLEPVDVAVRGHLAGLADRLRKVGIDPLRGRTRLVDDDGSEGADDHDQRDDEAQVHNRDGQTARNPRPTGSQIRQALAGNLCRCGSHVRVIRAVMRVATPRGGR